MQVRDTLALLIVIATVGPVAEAANPSGVGPANTASSADTLQEVVVTGSRVITNGNNAPTPVTVLAVEQSLSLRPTVIADALNDLPIFSGSQTQTSNPGTTSAASSAANVMNLRNMGPTRTLLLFNGHRLAPSEIDATVDANMVPQMFLQRVDVVTGGASAVYGSDAVTGVVNFITDTKFNGLKMKAQAGQSAQSDDKNVDLGIAGGLDLLSGRGHFEASYELYNTNGVLARSARPWGRRVLTVQGSGTAAAPYVLVQNTRNANTSFGGSITSGVLSGQVFAQPGVLSPLVHGSPAYPGGYESGGGGAYNDGSIKAPLRSHQFYSRLDFRLTDAVNAYVEDTATWNSNSQRTNFLTLNNVNLSSQNAFLPTAYQNQLSAAGQTTFRLSKVLANSQQFTPQINERQIFVVGGLTGTFGSAYRWDVADSHSQNDTVYNTYGMVNNAKLYAALDAVVNPATGQAACRVTLTNPGLYPNCVPLNVFGPNSESQAALDYVAAVGRVSYTFLMDDVTAGVSGAPFKTWAGPVNMAVSGEYRDLGYNVTSNVLATDLVNCTGLTTTGLTSNCSATSALWSAPTNSRSPKSQRVWEFAGEMDMPLLADARIAKALNLNAAVRYTKYNVSGSATTWKAGLVWHINDQLTARATRSRDIRAPNLNNLYSAATAVQIPNTDLLTSTAPLVPTYFSGNPNLTPEVANTWTTGFVWRPMILPQLSISLDGYDMKVNNAIVAASGSNALFQQICYASAGVSPYCGLQTRPINYTNTSAANAVTAWYSSPVNISEQRTYGADLEVNFQSNLRGRPFSVRGLVDYQPHISYSQPGVLTYDMGGIAFNSNNLTASPVLRATAFLRYSPIDKLSVDIMERWRSSLQFGPVTTLVFATPTIPSVAYTNLNLTYSLSKARQTDIFFTVSNLFDTQPPAAANFGANGQVGLAGGFVSGDDPIGREYTAGFRLRF